MPVSLVNGSCFFPDRNRLFPIRKLPDGTPCIIGTPPDQFNADNAKVVVYSSTGEHTKAHPGNKPYEMLYEIHLGDFVGVLEHDLSMDCYVAYSYHIQFIGPDGMAHGVPAAL